MESIIELRQENGSTLVNSNGDYIVNLQSKITIEKGDEITLKNVFLDTVDNTSGQIEITKDNQNLDLTFGLYFTDQPSTAQLAWDKNTYYQTPLTNDDRPNGKNYILSSLTDPSDTHIAQQLENIQINDIVTPIGHQDEHIKLFFQYMALDGVTLVDWHFQMSHVYLRKHIWKKGTTLNITREFIKTHTGSGLFFGNPPVFPIVYKTPPWDAVIRVNPNNVNSEGNGFDNLSRGQIELMGASAVDVPTGKKLFQPWTFQKKAVLRIGTYSKQAFAQHMTDALTDPFDGAERSNFMSSEYVDNHMLVSKNELNLLGTTQGKTPVSGTKPYWCCEDGSDIAQCTDTQFNYVFGSSQCAIGYNPETDLFFIDAIHSSIYNKSSKAVMAMINGAGQTFLLNKTGGIYLIHCNQAALFTESMLFQDTIFTDISDSKEVTMGTLNECIVPIISLIDGLNVTSEQNALDSFISKSSEPDITTPANSISFDLASARVASTTTPGITNYTSTATLIGERTSIYALSPNASTLKTGYYQIIIESNYNLNKVSNQQSNRFVNAIVSKYFNTSNYTIGDSSNALTYVHESETPLFISSFHVKILDPDNSASQTLNVDNTVFLQLIKNK